MLLLICLWSILTAACSMIGAATVRRAAPHGFDRLGDRFMAAAWLGVAVLGVALLAVSLVAPLTPAVGAAVAGVLLVPALLGRGARRDAAAFGRALLLSPRLAAGALVWAAGVAAYAARPVTWYDTGLYHYGVVRWLSRFGAVPGLALIHSRFGIASSWLALTAPFDYGFAEARSGALTGGFALLLAGLHFLLCLRRCLAGQARLSDWVLVTASALFLPIIIYWDMPVSSSPNLPVVVFGVLVAWSIVLVAEGPASSGAGVRVSDAALVPLLLSVAAVTFKLNAAPLAVVSAIFYLTRRGVTPRGLAALFALGLLVAAPVVGYQTLTAGCPVFPLSLACLDVPWRVDRQEAAWLVDAVNWWARWGGPAPADATSLNWLWRGWLLQGTTYKSALALAAAALVALAGFLITRHAEKFAAAGRWLLALGVLGAALLMMFRTRNVLMLCVPVLALLTFGRRFPGKNWLLALGFSGLALVMSSGPDLGFGLGYVAVLFACFVVSYVEALQSFFERAGRRFPFTSSPRLALATLLAAAGLMVGLYRVVAPGSAQESSGGAAATADAHSPLVLPPRLSAPASERRRINDVEYFVPVVGDQCWATEIPCTSALNYPDLALRDARRGIAAGFRRGGHSPQPPAADLRR